MTDPRYIELHAASAFSFLASASQPETLIERAAQAGMPAIALECPAAFVPESMRQTGMRGAIHGTRKEAYG